MRCPARRTGARAVRSAGARLFARAECKAAISEAKAVTVRVWRAEAGDAGMLQRLERDAFAEKSWGAESVAGSFGAPAVEVLFAGAEAKAPHGFLIWRELGVEAEILSVGVASKHRRSGVAKALLDALVRRARNAGAASIFLEVDAGNEAAIALYQGHGFRSIARRKAYYRNGADAVIMRSDIPAAL